MDLFGMTLSHKLFCEIWERWCSELPLLCNHLIPHCYFPKGTCVTSVKLHGFRDATESAYAGAVHLRVTDSKNSMCVMLVSPYLT